MRRLLLILFLASSAAAQSISSIEPSSAPASGGTFVHIYGTDLIGFALACPTIECADYVKFGEVLGQISADNGNEIVALVPSHDPGTVDLTVNVAGKKKMVLPGAFTYLPATNDQAFVLLPVLADRVPGAFGSIWQTDASFSNNSDGPIDVEYGICPGQGLLCHDLILPPHQTVMFPAATEDLGVFVTVPRTQLAALDLQLRVHDVSRESLTWGTAVPVVRNTDFKPVVRLHNVPTDSRFRTDLRLYSYPGSGGVWRMQIFDEATGALLVTDNINFKVSALASAYPQVQGHETVRIEISSATDPPRPLWAFVSVTNNETQHVTVIAPSP